MSIPKINSAHGSDTRNVINRAIDVLNQYGMRIQDLVAKGQLTPEEYARLLEIVNNMADEIVVDNKLATKRDKEVAIRLADLHTDVKDAMTGGSVAVVGENAVGKENIKDSAVTQEKRTAMGEIGLITGAQPAEVDFSLNEIRFSPTGVTHYVMHRGISYAIPSNTTIKLTPSNGMSAIWFDTVTKEIIELRHTGYGSALTENHVLLGYVYINASNTLSAELFGKYSYIGDDTKQNSQGIIISGGKVDFDFKEKSINFPPTNHSYLFANGKRHLISNGTKISFEHLANQPMFRIMFNTKEEKVYVTNYSAKISNQDIPLGAVIAGSETVQFNGDYKINGQDTITFGMGEVKYMGSGAVDIDIENRKVTFPNPSAFLYVNGTEYRINESSKVVTLPEIHNNMRLMFNTETETFRVSTSSILRNEYLVMVIKLNDPIQIVFNGEYTINGAPVTGESLVDHNLEDMIWSWWIYPLAVRFKGMRDRTYIGYTDSKGYSGVGSLDNETGERRRIKLKNDRVDDHNAAAVDVMDDGRVITAYSTGHNSDGNIHIRVSSEIESVEAFRAATTVSTDGRITYAHLFNGGGKWYLFFRGPEGDECSYTSSVDGVNWSPVKTLIDYFHVCYPKIQYTTDPNVLRFVITTNPMSGEAHFRLAFFDMSTGVLSTESGTVLGTERVEKDNIPLIVERIPGMTQRLLDVAVTDRDETIMGYSVHSPEADASDIEYRVAHWKDNVLNVDTLVSAGKPFYKPSNYVGGMAFSYNKNEVYISREDNGIWHIEKWSTTNQLKWEKTETLHTSQPGYVALRPILEKNGDKILWHEGKYQRDSYSDYYTDVKYKKIRTL